MSPVSLDDARAAKAKAMEIFGRLVVVVGVGITRIDGGYGIKVNLREQPAPGVDLPQTVNGVPVRVEVVGPIRKR
ncbi:MAG: hypothetical protein HY725_13895 [Candidatus Rokubacteria bacterium]|nr:hypothetical protein [Candidatus Rokubacteria bacterium]